MGEHVIIRIEDNGAGFPPQEAEHIFDLFQSAHAHERDAYPGTGAGLMIVRRIVERHGGEIWAESQGAGEGAMFVMKWPSKSYGEEN